MTDDPRIALNQLIAALEHHYDIARNADVVSEAVFEDAEVRLQDAFFTYDDVLFTNSGVVLPLELMDDEYEEDEEDEDDEEDEVDDIDEEDLDDEEDEDLVDSFFEDE